MINEKGSLKDSHIIKILLKIREGRLTGILYLQRGETRKTLYFSNGNFTWATSTSVDDSLLTIFIRKRIIAPEAGSSLKQESWDENSGRFLVEKGLISLEDLINGSREQLRQILLSTFTWGEGEFQFVMDKPPERIVSLDIDIMKLIWENLQQEFEMELFWKELGSLNTVIRYNPVHLPDPTTPPLLFEIASFLKEPNRLETVINHFSTYKPQLIVKALFFMMQMELLEKDPEAVAVSITPPPPAIKIDEPRFDDLPPEEEKEQFVFAPSDFEKLAPKGDTPFLSEPQSSGRQKFWIIFIVIVILFLAAAIGYLFLSEKKERDKMLNQLQEVRQESAALGKKVPDQTASALQEGRQQERPEPVKAGGETKPQPEKRKPAGEVTPDKNQEQPLPEPGKREDQGLKKETPDNSSLSPLEELKKRNLFLAADLWKAELESSSFSHSILLELDCLKESVFTAASKFSELRSFFILPRKRNGQTCFLVLFGRFSSAEQAAAELKNIPSFFWKQNPPPQVIELSAYKD